MSLLGRRNLHESRLRARWDSPECFYWNERHLGRTPEYKVRLPSPLTRLPAPIEKDVLPRREFLTFEEAANLAGVHVMTVYRWARSGQITLHGEPHSWRRIRRADIWAPP